LKAPGFFNPLSLKCDILCVQAFAFKCNLHRYIEGIERAKRRTASDAAAAASAAAGGAAAGPSSSNGRQNGAAADEAGAGAVGAEGGAVATDMDVDGGDINRQPSNSAHQPRMKRRRQHEPERAPPAPVLVTHPLFASNVVAAAPLETTGARTRGGGAAAAAAGGGAQLASGGDVMNGANGMNGNGYGNGVGVGVGRVGTFHVILQPNTKMMTARMVHVNN
jgi:hypothetical protein